MKELGIYVHIPFCKKKCYYCDFISFANKEEKIEEYISSLLIEIKEELNKIKKKEYEITTIYIGGGTPSIINERHIKQIVEQIKDSKILSSKVEITIEVNPGTVNELKLEEYKKIGINRLSIGLQATNNELLKEIGRIHTYEEFLNCYNLARKVGFENINVDLMLGLPNQTLNNIRKSLKEVIKLDPEHISFYSLIVEENTILEKMIDKKELVLPKEDLERKMYHEAKKVLEENGYIHYEISNFAKKGYISKHNFNCWMQKEYLGFGVSAHSYFDNKRYCNTNNLEEYIKNIENKNSKTNRTICEIQTKKDKQKEYMLLGLRKIEGVSIKDFKNKFVENPIFLFRIELEKLVNQNLIEIDGDNIRLTNKGLDFANVVWKEFI